MKLGKRTLEVLRQMAKHRHHEDGELTHAVPGGWWLGDTQVSGVIGSLLLRLVLISEGQFCSENYRIYHINEEGRMILGDPSYTPIILRVQSQLRTEKQHENL